MKLWRHARRRLLKKNVDKSSISSGAETNLTKKNSVTMYNHATRDSRDIPCGDSGLVVRNLQQNEDAYSQALKEVTTDNPKDKEHRERLQEMRNKVAMTKQTVEKEYNDTMSFLKSLPKEKNCKHVKNAHMDDRRHRILKVSRQQKLQQEFNKIERECRKRNENENALRNTPGKSRQKSKSPAGVVVNDFDTRDLQYSWMPVPEGDGNLAIHTIPTTLKEGKSANTVKFSTVDSYHEYRSRHKHTPPTKDTNPDRHGKRVVETVLIQNDENESTDCSSISSDTSSVENLNIGNNNNTKPDQDISEAERIIIYKILESKQGKKEKERKKKKLIDDVAKVIKSMSKDKSNKSLSDSNNNKAENLGRSGVKDTDTRIPLDQIDEGVYKVVNEKGLSYNVTSCYTANVEMWQTTAEQKSWWDNITSLYFSDKPRPDERKTVLTEDNIKLGQPCCCKRLSNNHQSEQGTIPHCGGGDLPETRVADCGGCKHVCINNFMEQVKPNLHSPAVEPSAATSTSSFKTATTDKAHDAASNGGYIKLIDDDGQEAGKFFIGASNFLKDDAYEVIIQLRKKETASLELEKEGTKNGTEETVVPAKVSKEADAPPDDKLKSAPIEEPTDNHIISFNKNITHPAEETHNLLTPSKEKLIVDKSAKEKNMEDYKNSSEHASTDSSNGQIPYAASRKKFHSKGVCTSEQLSYAIPSHVPITDPIPRPATSTYTQTTMESPNTRPVFIHMSSSTSTAYMSPPEMVLPNFMRRNHDTMDGTSRCENAKCARKRCRCYKTTTAAAGRQVANRELSTPPNTARNNDENSDTYDNAFEWPVRKAHSKKNHKCENRNSAHKLKGHRKSSKASLHKLSSRNLVMRVSSSTASSFKNKANNLQGNKKKDKIDLNPTLKKYVDKLLTLNREGLKAIEVANQECSSVSTPGSSIIEVPRNLNEKKSDVENKISLEQMKNVLKQKILEEYAKNNADNNSVHTSTSHHNHKSRANLYKLPKKKSILKVKSLNISKRIMKTQKTDATSCSIRNVKTNPSASLPSSTRDLKFNKPESTTRSRSKSSPTPRRSIESQSSEYKYKKSSGDKAEENNKRSITEREIRTNINEIRKDNNQQSQQQKHSEKTNSYPLPFINVTTSSPDSGINLLKRQIQDETVTNISTQTSQDLDSEINLMKLAEDKLQNMEKIADLTEKCTKRLSNLAKVLEEVRRNKSQAYSQISTSDTASDSDQKSDKNVRINNAKPGDPANDVQSKSDFKSSTPLSNEQEKEEELSVSSEYISFLTDIPKPAEFKYPIAPSATQSVAIRSKPSINSHVDSLAGKRRDKPPPALSRIHLKHGQDVVPHELSTVMEVDSPMSVKLKNHSSRNDTKHDVSDRSYALNTGNKDQKRMDKHGTTSTNTEPRANPDLLQRNTSVSQLRTKISSTDSSDDSKIQMMDLKQFNELMLQPFISINEFAKQCGDIGTLDDGSNLDDVPKDEMNDELSSLHSDGSLPDVIAELLKRNIISEPFKFDTMSNVNSTTVSSESTSVLALSKAKKDRKKASIVLQNKENISETSDTLSISSNPDLENAFKKLGMGWASSTLKKTKERLALSSSTNTSSSSLSQFKLKCLNNQDIPAVVTDSVSTATKLTSKKQQDRKSDIANVEQQTSLMNSMTVREFLTNELAKKITFTNKSNRNDTEEEFVSLFETKMPEEMKNLSQTVREERSIDSLRSGQNRARTSTPVQIFKSMTYHSSSSSNMSNGLFSNADDLSSVKVTSNSIRNHSTSDKDDLTIPNCSLKTRKGASDSKSE